jgi:cysteine desulfurase / selenocysteine lyase
VFEPSSQNVVGFVAMEASLDILLELGVSSIFAHVQGYLNELETAVVARGFESLRPAELGQRSGILSFRVGPALDPVRLHRSLLQSGIACSLPDGLLRFAPHFPNSRQEVPWIAEAIDEAMAIAKH